MLYQRRGASVVAYYEPRPVYKLRTLRSYDSHIRAFEKHFVSDPGRYYADLPAAACSRVLSGRHNSVSGDFQHRADGFARCVRRLENSREKISEILLSHKELGVRPDSGLRDRDVWIDSPSPELSWYVAPRAARVISLSIAALRIRDSDLSTLTTGLCAMLRLLQIHPFGDGNGRLCRALFLAHCTSALGHEPRLIGLTESLWTEHAFKLHQASRQLIAAESWDPYLEFCIECLDATFRTKPN